MTGKRILSCFREPFVCRDRVTRDRVSFHWSWLFLVQRTMTSLESFGRLLYTFSYVIIYLFFSSEKKFLMALTKYLIKIFLFVILLSPCLFLSIWNVHIPTRCWHGSNDSLGSLAYTCRDLQWSRILRGHSWIP